LSKLKVAFIGLKGIPAKWGGIEVYVEEIAKRLVQRGHEVTVYCRKWFTENNDFYSGIKIVKTPTIKTKATDALLHGFTSSLHASFQNYNVIHCHGLASYYSSIFPKLWGKRVVITVHATSWNEPKWNHFAAETIKRAAFLGMRMADTITTISPFLKNFLEEISGKRVILTPPGVNIKPDQKPKHIYEKYGLKGQDYILFMGRLDSVKRIDWIIKAFKALSHSNELKLVIAGDPGPSDSLKYKNYLIRLTEGDTRIIFTGFQSGRIKEELLSNCLLFVLPSISEGVPIALLEAMSYGRPSLVSIIPAHTHIIHDNKNGFLAPLNNFECFCQKLQGIIALNQNILQNIGDKAKKYIQKNFNWEVTVKVFEKIYYNLLGGEDV